MGVFYLQVENEIWELDSTSDVTQSLKGSLSSSRVEDGRVSSDNYVTDPVTVTFSGIISDVKSLTSNTIVVGSGVKKNTEDYLRTLKEVYRQKKPISVSFSSQSEFLKDCFFTSLDISQSVKNGVHYNPELGFTSSYSLRFSLQQVRYAKSAEVVRAPDEALSEALAAERERNASTTDPCAGDDVDPVLCNINLELAVLKAGR